MSLRMVILAANLFASGIYQSRARSVIFTSTVVLSLPYVSRDNSLIALPTSGRRIFCQSSQEGKVVSTEKGLTGSPWTWVFT
jgi:hypothetical protein